jgi:protein-tyrosine phosphatase
LKKKILCVCLGNTCRSPMVEALLRRKFKQMNLDHIVVESAGLVEGAKEGKPANPKSIQAMKDMGVDITTHKSSWVNDHDLSEYAHIFTVGKGEAERLNQMVSGDTQIHIVNGNDELPNPWEKDQEVYNETREIIVKWIAQEADRLYKMVE